MKFSLVSGLAPLYTETLPCVGWSELAQYVGQSDLVTRPWRSAWAGGGTLVGGASKILFRCGQKWALFRKPSSLGRCGHLKGTPSARSSFLTQVVRSQADGSRFEPFSVYCPFLHMWIMDLFCDCVTSWCWTLNGTRRRRR